MDGNLVAAAAAITRRDTCNLTRAGVDWLMLDGVDGRSTYRRRFKQVALGLVRELELSEADLSDSLKLRIRTAALAVVDQEVLQAQFANGELASGRKLIALGTAQGRVTRALWALGLHPRAHDDLGRRSRKPKKPTGKLAKYLERA
jgi:hypothetical protein